MTDTLSTRQKKKQALVEALEANDFAAVEKFASRNRQAISMLMRLAYDKETLVGWRAIIAIGKIATIYSRNNHEFLRETVRKLLWSLTDESGGIGWSAPEILGEIVGADPEKFSDIVPMIAEVFSIEEAIFKPGVLYAFKKIAESCPESISPYQDIIIQGLSEQDPQARVYALELIRILGERIDADKLADVEVKVKNMIQDDNEAWIYRKEGFVSIEVRETAIELFNNKLKERHIVPKNL